MIKGFEKQTRELSLEELKLIPLLIKGLSNKIGKDAAVTGSKICEALRFKGPRLRKMINFIRITNQLPALCSCSNGYFVAANTFELQECIISLKQRLKSQVDVLNALESQDVVFGGTGQTTLFE